MAARGDGGRPSRAPEPRNSAELTRFRSSPDEPRSISAPRPYAPGV